MLAELNRPQDGVVDGDDHLLVDSHSRGGLPAKPSESCDASSVGTLDGSSATETDQAVLRRDESHL